MGGKPQLNFSQHFDHNIWKIHAFAETPYLILEIRDQEKLQVSFTVVDLFNNQLVAEGITLDESWWVSVAHAIENQVIFYTFDADENPKPKSFFLMKVGNPHEIVEQKEFDLPKFINQSTTQNIDIQIPFHYSEGTEYFQTVAEFIDEHFLLEIKRGVDYFEKGDRIFISYFVNQENTMANFLLVIDKDKQVLLNEKLGEYNQGFADNTFFIIDNKLIFVKGVFDFFIYDLSL